MGEGWGKGRGRVEEGEERGRSGGGKRCGILYHDCI